jgi:hypothetical protein
MLIFDCKCDLDLGGRWPVAARDTSSHYLNNCGKYLQNSFKDKKVMDRTWHMPSNRQCWPWMSKCDLDPGGTGLVVAHDTLSYYNKHLCQVIQILLINDKVMDPTQKRLRNRWTLRFLFKLWQFLLRIWLILFIYVTKKFIYFMTWLF